jgi:sortase A
MKRSLTALRTRKGPRRILTVFTVLLLLGGIGLLSYPFATDMFANYKQGRLQSEFSTSPSIKDAYLTRTIQVGHALTRLRIPKLGVDTIVVEGTTLSALRAGSGHYPRTPLPCEPGNVAIAGHRTTYSKPFAEIEKLRPGDMIVLESPVGKCWYEVDRKPWSTDPYDWSVARSLRGSFLTLTTCDPPGSAARRLIVRARLVKSDVEGLPVPPPPRSASKGKNGGVLPGDS